MSWLEAFRVQKILLENPGCYVSFWEVALQLFIPLLFVIPPPWPSSGSVQVYLDGTGAASSPLSRCVSSPLVEGTYNQHMRQWHESCTDAQGPPATPAKCCRRVENPHGAAGGSTTGVKHKSQLDTPVKKTPYFCHRWWPPRIILLCTSQGKMEYLVTDVVYSRGTFLKYVK